MLGPGLVSNDWGRKLGRSAPGCKTQNRARKRAEGPAAAWVKGHEMQTWQRLDSVGSERIRLDVYEGKYLRCAMDF